MCQIVGNCEIRDTWDLHDRYYELYDHISGLVYVRLKTEINLVKTFEVEVKKNMFKKEKITVRIYNKNIRIEHIC